jgi:hypothetical protein
MDIKENTIIKAYVRFYFDIVANTINVTNGLSSSFQENGVWGQTSY